jgi:hypothetical protein
VAYLLAWALLTAIRLLFKWGHGEATKDEKILHFSFMLVPLMLELVEIQVCVTKTFAFNEVCLQ